MGGWQPQCHRPAASLELSTFCFSAAEPPPPPPLSLSFSSLLTSHSFYPSQTQKYPIPPKVPSLSKALPPSKLFCFFQRTFASLLIPSLELSAFCFSSGSARCGGGRGGSLASSPTRCTAPLFYGTCIYHCDHSCAGVVQELDHNQPLFFIVASRTDCNGTFP